MPRDKLGYRRFLFGAVALAGVVGIAYLRHIDFPPTDGAEELRSIAGYTFDADDVYYYRSRNFMDTWHLFRARILQEDLHVYVGQEGVESKGEVEYFDLIISRPPPYWWRPKRLPRASLYEGTGSDGRSVSVMHDSETGTAYFLVY